jgi:hypothetical protein
MLPFSVGNEVSSPRMSNFMDHYSDKRFISNHNVRCHVN